MIRIEKKYKKLLPNVYSDKRIHEEYVCICVVILLLSVQPQKLRERKSDASLKILLRGGTLSENFRLK